MYVCMYVCMHDLLGQEPQHKVYIRIDTHTYTHIYMHTYIRIYMHNAPTHTHKKMCVHIYTYTYIAFILEEHTYIHIYMHTYMMFDQDDASVGDAHGGTLCLAQ